MMAFIKNIAFFGSSEAKKNSSLYVQTFQVARILAQKGYVIVNGGGPGVMDAATQGAESAKGETIAITFRPKEEAPGFEGRYPKNITDEEIETGNYVERVYKLLEHGDLYIFFKGGTGTFSEFATAWCLGRLYYGLHKPMILYGSFWRKIINCFRENMCLRKEEAQLFKIVDSPEKTLEAVGRFEEEYSKRLKKYLKRKGARLSGSPIGYRGPEFNIESAQKGGRK